ncbi:MAG: hypothetical protein WA116_04330 [Anaerolineaceae bacterium]
MTRYEFLRKTRTCPVYKSKRIATIQYGYPIYSEDLQRKLDEGKITIGGCCITEDDPKWECVDCGVELFKKNDLFPTDKEPDGD